MSLIIKGMDMPSSCEDCRFYGIEVEGGCAVVKMFSVRLKSQTKPDWCPLVELPNTDLVDADTVEFWGETEHGYRWTGKIFVHREKESDHETN